MDTPTNHTINFLSHFFDLKGKNILEVGCGDGKLAMEMGRLGANIVGIDTDGEAIKLAATRGVKAEISDAASYKSTRVFDIILFSRSLHHISQLACCLENLTQLLPKEGKVVLEEFDHEHVNEETMKWYYEKKAVLNTQPPTSLWKKEYKHDPPLHTGTIMRDQVRQVATIEYESRCAYLYRNLEKEMTNDRRSLGLKSLLDEESEQIRQGKILPLGFRLIASKRIYS